VSPRKAKPKPAARSFDATLERSSNRLNWVIARIPFDVAKIWRTRGQLRVKGAINGFAFRTSLFPTGNGDHVMLVNKRMQAGAGTGVGAVAQFRLEPDTEERVITVPPELARALSEDRSLGRWFDRFNYSTRRWIVDWITQVKSAEARVRRANQIAERLLSAMEAERELPPILRDAFARHGRAYEGWKRMSPSHRRGHLLGIFGYRDPASRARRVAKTVQEAQEFAERGSKPSQRRSSLKA
jgi:uncharacterized protein YdeI (YjbR/CyaY-like superfamily)